MKVRKTQIYTVFLLIMAFMIGFFSLAHANMGYMNAFVSQYPKSSLATNSNCVVCHTSPPTLNPYGSDFKKKKFNFVAIESMDSDGDKIPNRTELDNGTYPGDPSSPLPPPTDTTPPTVTSLNIPPSSNSLMVPITSFLATDNVGVTGYLVTESSSKPNASDSGWSDSVPQNYTFTTGGTKTLYAFAKDAAGNVSDGLSATVTVTLPPAGDMTPPTVTSFGIPTTSGSLTVPINSFTATDDVAVMGYLVTESSATPSASASGWSGSAPSTYTFPSEGTKTLYAWAKDAAGNVSISLSATVTITLPPISDKTPPTVTDFSIPGTADSLTIPINKFTATDNIGVTGYKLTESATTPNASAPGWSISAPSTYAFVSEGPKTLYAWAKDAAGNVSSSLSAAVTITLPPPSPAGDMEIWVEKWFKVTSRYTGYLAQGSALSSQRLSVVGYLRIRSWNPDQNVFEADLYEYDSQSGEWITDSLPLQFLTGSKLDFICWFQMTGDLMSGVTARFQGRETNGTLSGATLKTLGGYYIGISSESGDGSGPIEHDAGGLSITGNLSPEARIPVPTAIVKQ